MSAEDQIRQVVQQDDLVQIDFICKEPTGEIIMTSIPSVAQDLLRKKSSIYQEQEKYEPLQIYAGQEEKYADREPLKIFKNELVAKLSRQVLGMKVGESASITLKASVPRELVQQERYISLARNRTHNKFVTQSLDRVRQVMGRAPVLGETFVTSLGLLGKIQTITEKEVKIAFTGINGNQVDTPWGKGLLKDQGEKWQLVIQPQIGNLVLTGPYAGRISAVGDKMFTVDFGYPFGRETVDCNISVVSIVKKQVSKIQ